MRKKQNIAEMTDEVLLRQAKARAKRTREPFKEALEAVMGAEASRQIEKLREGPHHGEMAQEWQEGLARDRAEERAEAPGWSSPNEGLDSLVNVSRRGPR
jgi:hypothetical protein